MAARRLRVMALNIRSLWNVGSLFRTADAFAVEHVYLAGYTALPPRREISKTALGAEAWIPFESVAEPVAVITQLKADGWQIISLELSPQAKELSTIKLTDRVCLVVGNEISGVPAELQALSSDIAFIPMLGKKESLNVAVATGIALYALRND
jgi:23S rRNA (guanosine2251-2'-O)-methyltransferase